MYCSYQVLVKFCLLSRIPHYQVQFKNDGANNWNFYNLWDNRNEHSKVFQIGLALDSWSLDENLWDTKVLLLAVFWDL